MPTLYDWDPNMTIVGWTNGNNHRVVIRSKAKQTNYFNGVIPAATNKNRHIENNDINEEVVIQKK